MKLWLPLSAILSLVSAATIAAEYPGTVTWNSVTTLSSPLTGRVTSVKVEEGDRITKGQLLATLDPRIYQATVKRAKARLASVQSRFDDISREYGRAQELYERTVLSQTDLQAAEVRYLSSEAELHQAQAELELAKINLEYTQLRAPFEGIVVERNINPYETVSNQLKITPMIRVAKEGDLAASFNLPQKVASQLRKGAALKVRIGTAGASPSTVVRILPASSTANGSTRVVITTIPSPETVTAGQAATLSLP